MSDGTTDGAAAAGAAGAAGAAAPGGSGSLPWSRALVTGASSGIGEAIARDLAARRVRSLVVVARRTGRLGELAEELHGSAGTEVEVLTADLATVDGVGAVADRLRSQDSPVDLLVNNAGFGTPGTFAEVDLAELTGQVQVNVIAAMELMHAALGVMLPRGGGAVLNVASLGAWQPLPTSAVYGAGKAFLLSLGEAVHEELHGSGVTVTTTCPGFVRTEFQERYEGSALADLPGFVWMDAASVAAASLDAAAAGRAVCVPGLGYRALAWATDPVPRAPKRWMMGRMISGFDALRRRLG